MSAGRAQSRGIVTLFDLGRVLMKFTLTLRCIPLTKTAGATVTTSSMPFEAVIDDTT